MTLKNIQPYRSVITSVGIMKAALLKSDRFKEARHGNSKLHSSLLYNVVLCTLSALEDEYNGYCSIQHEIKAFHRSAVVMNTVMNCFLDSFFHFPANF